MAESPARHLSTHRWGHLVIHFYVTKETNALHALVFNTVSQA